MSEESGQWSYWQTRNSSFTVRQSQSSIISNSPIAILSKGWFPYDRGSRIANRRSLLLRSSAITRSAICADDRRPYCDHMRSYGPAFMFYLLRSSAIVCDHDRRIADDRRSMFPYDRRRSQTIADLIAICEPRSYGNQP